MGQCRGMHKFLAPFLLLAIAPVQAVADSGAVCVQNSSDTAWTFVAHADGGMRRVETLAPGGLLCSAGQAMGTVAVFESKEDLEGCSLRVSPGSTARLFAFPGVDLCRWESS